MHNQQTVAPLVMPASSRHGSQRPPLNKGAGFLRGNKRTDVVGTAAAWRGASGTSLQQAFAARTPWVPTGCTREDSLRHATVGKQGAHGYSSLIMGSIFEFGWHACALAGVPVSTDVNSAVPRGSRARLPAEERRPAPHAHCHCGVAHGRRRPAADGEPAALRRLATARGPGVATFNATI